MDWSVDDGLAFSCDLVMASVAGLEEGLEWDALLLQKPLLRQEPLANHLDYGAS